MLKINEQILIVQVFAIKMTEWKNIHADLLRFICNILDVTDVMRIRRVCKDWSSSLKNLQSLSSFTRYSSARIFKYFPNVNRINGYWIGSHSEEVKYRLLILMENIHRFVLGQKNESLLILGNPHIPGKKIGNRDMIGHRRGPKILSYQGAIVAKDLQCLDKYRILSGTRIYIVSDRSVLIYINDEDRIYIHGTTLLTLEEMYCSSSYLNAWKGILPKTIKKFHITVIDIDDLISLKFSDIEELGLYVGRISRKEKAPTYNCSIWPSLPINIQLYQREVTKLEEVIGSMDQLEQRIRNAIGSIKGKIIIYTNVDHVSGPNVIYGIKRITLI